MPLSDAEDLARGQLREDVLGEIDARCQALLRGWSRLPDPMQWPGLMTDIAAAAVKDAITSGGEPGTPEFRKSLVSLGAVVVLAIEAIDLKR
jgi:hypothetical protein